MAPETKPPPWLRIGGATESVLVGGVQVIVRLRDGRHFVGRVEAVMPWGIALRPWGRALALRIPSTEIYAASVVGPHSYAEERAVRQRQAAGLAAWEPPPGQTVELEELDSWAPSHDA